MRVRNVNCDEVHHLLHGYLDHELDLVRTLDIERHLQTCPACTQALAEQEKLRTALRSPALYHRPGADFTQRLHQSLRRAGRPESSARAGRLLGLAASLLAAVCLGWALAHWTATTSPEDPLALAVLSSHIRSLQPAHLLDMSSSDQHQVKPWFNGRIDFSPPVKDLTKQGFPLVGGRLDYLADRNVAVLVYKRRQHIINLFIWPSDSGDQGRIIDRQGYHMIHWSQGSLSYWAVSDLNEAELQEFVHLIRG